MATETEGIQAQSADISDTTVIVPFTGAVFFFFFFFARRLNNQLYLHDHINTYSVAKAFVN